MITQAVKIKPAGRVDTHRGVQAYVSAEDARPHTPYYCPLCGTLLYLTLSKNGIKYFRCYPHHPHTKKICQTASSSTRVVDTNTSDFNPNEFFAQLLTEETTSGNGGGGTSGGNPGGSPKGTPGGPGDDPMLKVCAPRTIEDLVVLGYPHSDPNRVINRKDGIKVKDLILSYPALEMLLKDESLLDGTDRIVEGRPLYGDGKKITLRMFSKKEDGTYNYVYFSVHASNSKVYTTLEKKLFEKKTDEKGISKTNRKVASVLVGGFWTRVKDQFFDGISYPCYETKVHNVRKQLYVLE